MYHLENVIGIPSVFYKMEIIKQHKDYVLYIWLLVYIDRLLRTTFKKAYIICISDIFSTFSRFSVPFIERDIEIFIKYNIVENRLLWTEYFFSLQR